MCRKKDPKKGCSLDTLAQLGTENCNHSDNQEFTDLRKVSENTDNLRKRAKRNFIKNALALGLVSVNDKDRQILLDSAVNSLDEIRANNHEKDILRSYWNMYYCSSTLVRKNGKVSGRYCKNRLCLVCNSIRAAVSLKKYKPVFDEWGDNAYFVTLTAPTIKRELLDSRLNEMHKIVKAINEVLKRRNQRGKGKKFIGVRKLECTYRPHTDKFHPHFHFLIKGKENAEFLYQEWLSRTQHLGTSEKAQDCRKADKNAAIEVFKYFTKIVSKSSKDKLIYLRGLDCIFKAFRGRRVIQNFGFKLPKEDPKEVLLSLADKSVSSLEDLQRVLSDSGGMAYVMTLEFLELVDSDPLFMELTEFAMGEQNKGVPFLYIEQLLELIEDMKGDFEEQEELFKWELECTDWVSHETGEMLTGFKPSSKEKSVVKKFTIYQRKTQ